MIIQLKTIVLFNWWALLILGISVPFILRLLLPLFIFMCATCTAIVLAAFPVSKNMIFFVQLVFLISFYSSSKRKSNIL